ncbi:MAG: hypothetical protein UZ08_BCD001002316 [Candidatus Parvibacillus calidus]|jgi:hypothetical protein|nr:MAG: hypothetical protein UZ08_BCD001002316 [Candidatus Parvibacillus calidus]
MIKNIETNSMSGLIIIWLFFVSLLAIPVSYLATILYLSSTHLLHHGDFYRLPCNIHIAHDCIIPS